MLEPTASVQIRGSLLLPKAVPDVDKVGIFEDANVEEPENNIHHNQEGSRWKNFFKNVKYNILGVTVKATIVWAIVYIISIIINQVGNVRTKKCEEEKLWSIDSTGQLVNYHHKTATIWGLEQIGTSGIFYIKDKKKPCTTVEQWYQGISSTPNTTPNQPQNRRKRAITTQKICSATQTCTCPTQTFMGHDIKPVQFVPTGDANQKWKLDRYDIKTGEKNKTSDFFKLCLAEEPGKKTTATVDKKDPKKI